MRIAVSTTPGGLRAELIEELDYLIKRAKHDQDQARTVRDARYYKGRTHALVNYRDNLATLWVEHEQHSSVSVPDGEGGGAEAGN